MSDMIKRSVLCHEHTLATHLFRSATDLSRRIRTAPFQGDRAIKWPMLALRTGMRMGPCRHALSQAVVAGTMIVQPPVVVRVEAPEPTSMNPRRS